MKFDFKPKLTKVSYRDYCRSLVATSRKLGEGAFAKVYQHPTKKTRVLKVSKCDDTLARDGYYAFVKRIAKLHKHNPFLPRVYSVKVFKREMQQWPHYEFYFVVELEKLIKYHAIKRKDRLKWYDRVVYKCRAHLHAKDEVVLYTHPHRHVTNEALRSANKIIKQVSQRRNFFHDAHLGNVMWRIWSTGMHAVFTDPIA